MEKNNREYEQETESLDEEIETNEEKEYSQKYVGSKTVAIYGSERGYLRTILALWKYGWSNQATLCRRTKINSAQVGAILSRLVEAKIVEEIDQKNEPGAVNKRSKIFNINNDFRTNNPEFPDQLQDYYKEHLRLMLVEKIPLKKWVDVDSFTNDKQIMKIIQDNNLSSTFLLNVFKDRDEFYYKDGKIARCYGDYGALIPLEDIK